LDGLADTADALGGDSPAQALAIMRDPGIGAFGATALALDLLVKTGAVAALLKHGGFILVLLVAGAISRAVAPPLAAALPYARAETATGSVLSGSGFGLATWAAPALAAALAVLLLGARGAVALGAALALAVLLAVGYRRLFGGITGDALGAALELTETGVLVVALALA
jgi:adenosylcobinamide-GDP ribazoletransferase